MLSVFVASGLSLMPILLLPPAYVLTPSLLSCSLHLPGEMFRVVCVPVLHRLRCLYVFPRPSLVYSSFALAVDQVYF